MNAYDLVDDIELNLKKEITDYAWINGKTPTVDDLDIKDLAERTTPTALRDLASLILSQWDFADIIQTPKKARTVFDIIKFNVNDYIYRYMLRNYNNILRDLQEEERIK